MMKHFLWPRPNTKRAFAASLRLASIRDIENRLERMFPSGHPVLCSSGRAALFLALIESKVSRGDFVGLFPYASHCVFDAVSRLATPLSGPTAYTAPLRLVYHQWGYAQEAGLPGNSIEDCVDTLCVPGTKLFPGGGRYEIWSLPKILGTTSGGVLWCHDEATAIRIRELQRKRTGGVYHWALRLLGGKFKKMHSYWQGAESELGKITRLQTGEIIAAIKKWDDYVTDRRKKIEKVWPIAVEWLPKPSNRLPTVVPVHCKHSESIVQKLGISSGYRMFVMLESNGSRRMVEVLPIPIHQDVSELWVANLIEAISDQKKRDT